MSLERTVEPSESPLRLNIGAGESWSFAPSPWVNIDIRPTVGPDLVADARALPYGDGLITAIYAGHILEHLALDQVDVALREWLRVLEPAGRICVVGPDVVKGRALYERGEITRDRFDSLGLHDSERKRELARASYGTDTAIEDPHDPALHQWECTGLAIVGLLMHAGFVDVVEVPIGVAPFDFPIYDRTMADQFVVLGRKANA